MRLSEIVAIVPEAKLLSGDPDLEVVAAEIDSRAVHGGEIFCCVQGGVVDGHDFAPDVVLAGASALVTEHDVDLPLGRAVAEIRVPEGTMRSTVALISAAVAGNPSRALTLAGVTGTNGKTTVATLLGEILAASGYVTSVIGTLTGARTTPPAPELQRALAEVVSLANSMGRRGAVSMEVSSHALDQDRVGSVDFDVAIFTNLSHEHLDYHGTMEAYFEAKATLFEPQRSKRCVVWSESTWGRRLLERRPDAVGVDFSAAANLELTDHGARFVWRGERVQTSLVGRFNVANVLLAAEAALLLGIEPATIVGALEHASGIAGRMQRVEGPKGAPVAIIDYAHTPDALAAALVECRGLVRGGGALWVVFGCGGDRDQEKRPRMGAVASQLADSIVLTTDNPRSEDPAAIADAVAAGVDASTPLALIADRRTAIATAISGAGPGDVVLVAGKGHETTQIFAAETVEFDDVAVTAELLWGAPC